MNKTLLSAALIAAATLSTSVQADNSAWLKAKQPALSTSAAAGAPAAAGQPAVGSIAAWQQAKFPAVAGERVAPVERSASNETRVGSQAGWQQAKFPHLVKTGR